MATARFCFVLMPFGWKSDAAGKSIDFDAVYREVIKPAVAAAGLEPFRADEELTGGIIHKAMFERLVLCDYAVADLTLANANVFYELGVRHAARPWSTVSIYAGTSRLPFDVADLRKMSVTDRDISENPWIPVAVEYTAAPDDDVIGRRLRQRRDGK